MTIQLFVQVSGKETKMEDGDMAVFMKRFKLTENDLTRSMRIVKEQSMSRYINGDSEQCGIITSSSMYTLICTSFRNRDVMTCDTKEKTNEKKET